MTRETEEIEVDNPTEPLINLEETTPVVHELKNGYLVMPISSHPFKFSDGTTSPSQLDEVVHSLTLQRTFRVVKKIGDMNVNEVTMITSVEQEKLLLQLQELCDIIIAPFPLIVALRVKGNRHFFPKLLAFNATDETRRSPPSEKIVDVNNWSW